MAKKDNQKSAYELEIEQIQKKYDRQLQELKRQSRYSNRQSVRYAARGLGIIAFGRRGSYDKERGKDYLRMAGQMNMENKIVQSVEYQQIMRDRQMELEAAKQREIERRLIERETERAVRQIEREEGRDPYDGGTARVIPEEREGVNGLTAGQKAEISQLSKQDPVQQNREFIQQINQSNSALVSQNETHVTKGIGR